MTAEPTLFDASPTQREVDRSTRGRSRIADPETSREAASAISRSCEDAIRAVFAVSRALTDDELCALLPEWFGPTVKSARTRLSKRDPKTGRPPFLKRSADRRPSARGSRMIVWIRA